MMVWQGDAKYYIYNLSIVVEKVAFLTLQLGFGEALRIIESKITELFVLEGTFKGHLFKSHCNEQGYLQLEQIPQNHI